jgi:hypothetical protein
MTASAGKIFASFSGPAVLSHPGPGNGSEVPMQRQRIRRGPTPAYIVDPDTGCWVWQGMTNGRGYGRIMRDGRLVAAHRVYYELEHGPVAEGLVLDHLCRNSLCVNATHLEPVTVRVNSLRGAGLPAKNDAKTHCPQGHPLSGDNLYVAPSGGRECRTCNRVRQAAFTDRRAPRERRELKGTWNLTVLQCLVLDALEAAGPQSVAEIALTLHRSKQGVGRAVSALWDRGEVEIETPAPGPACVWRRV